jgi:hypothetical protein
MTESELYNLRTNDIYFIKKTEDKIVVLPCKINEVKKRSVYSDNMYTDTVVIDVEFSYNQRYIRENTTLDMIFLTESDAKSELILYIDTQLASLEITKSRLLTWKGDAMR